MTRDARTIRALPPLAVGLAAALANTALLAVWARVSSGSLAGLGRPALPAALAIAAVARLGDGGRDPAASHRFGAGRRTGGRAGSLASLATGLVLLAIDLAACASAAREPVHASVAHALASGAGLAVMACGAALRVAAVRALGSRFSDDHLAAHGEPLLRSGVYGWCRHPSELGLLALAFGFSLAGGSALALAGSAFLLVPLVGRRLAAEEAVLRRVYGGAHAEYRRSTPLLVPFVRG